MCPAVHECLGILEVLANVVLISLPLDEDALCASVQLWDYVNTYAERKRYEELTGRCVGGVDTLRSAMESGVIVMLLCSRVFSHRLLAAVYVSIQRQLHCIRVYEFFLVGCLLMRRGYRSAERHCCYGLLRCWG
jgi:hypothetical protein